MKFKHAKYIPLVLAIAMGMALLATEMENQQLEGVLLVVTGVFLYGGLKIANIKK